MTDRPRVLIEDWLPVTELGIESLRERKVFTDLPPLFGLHVWWARRPLVASGAVIAASLLPTWSKDLSKRPDPELQSEDEYQSWFLRLCGILGDPVAAKKAELAAVEAGIRISNPYTYKRAFKNSPSSRDLELFHDLISQTWHRTPSVMDPTAGGGSIPFEASRLRLPAVANDLNPVAGSVLRGGVEIPAAFGSSLTEALRHWGAVLVSRVRARLQPYYPHFAPDEDIMGYVFARTVACPRTGKPVPLAPNWWLLRGTGDTALELVTEVGGVPLDAPEFRILEGQAARDSDPDRGTWKGGTAMSPWDHLAIEGEYIRAEAAEGRLGAILLAIAFRSGGRRGYRLPTARDQEALKHAEDELARLLPKWEEKDVLPDEGVPEGSKTQELLQMGMTRWKDLFSARQLLAHGAFVEEFRTLVPEVRESVKGPEADAVLWLLGLITGKAINWNSLLSSWDASLGKIRSVFDTHNFAFKATFAEFEGASLYSWAFSDGIVRAYSGLCDLLAVSDEGSLTGDRAVRPPGAVTVTNLNGGNLWSVPDGSQTLVCIDPPYYDNVMYAELSDFFYVWEKRTLGPLDAAFFENELSDKASEAVANSARFSELGRRKEELAAADYEAKMGSIFNECHRALSSDGVLTVMFTHKSANAWDALGMALMTAGFTIEASWPINTESESSLHQARKNAAASTIMLACRKRNRDAGGHFFEDVEPQVRSEARRALERFSSQGIRGVDLLLSTYGPALSVISSQWPVYSSEPDPMTGRSRLLRPEEALDAARAEVTRVQRNRLVGREQALDPLTDFAMVAWDTFKAVEFPFDEARRLALAIGGLDIDELRHAKVLEKKSGTVVLLAPAKRVRRDADFEAGLPGVYPEGIEFTVALDVVHTAIYIADVDGLAAAKAFLDRAGLTADPRFLATLQGLVNAIPRTKVKGEWVVPEAETLDRLSAAYFPDVELPEEPVVPNFEQTTLLGED